MKSISKGCRVMECMTGSVSEVWDGMEGVV